jgi:hypothetical protein
MFAAERTEHGSAGREQGVDTPSQKRYIAQLNAMLVLQA